MDQAGAKVQSDSVPQTTSKFDGTDRSLVPDPEAAESEEEHLKKPRARQVIWKAAQRSHVQESQAGQTLPC